MDSDKFLKILGQLYMKLCLLEEDNNKLRLMLQAKEEEIGHLRGQEQTRVSNK